MDVKDMKQRLLNLEAVFSEKETLLTDLDRAIGDGDAWCQYVAWI